MIQEKRVTSKGDIKNPGSLSGVLKAFCRVKSIKNYTNTDWQFLSIPVS